MFKSDWLGVEEPEKNTHIEYISVFTAGAFSSAYIRISAKDYYKLYINGELIGQGPAPSFNDCYAFNEYDITGCLKSDENEIRAELYYQGLVNRVWTGGEGICGLIADIYADGRLIYGTGEDWLCRNDTSYTDGEIFGYDTGFAENRDFTKPPEKYRNAQALRCPLTFTGTAYPSLSLYPVGVPPVYENGIYFYDFLQEYVCHIRIFAVSDADGREIVLRAGEELENGRVKSELRCGCRYEERAILKKAENRFTQYDCKGLRYLEITAPEGVKVSADILVRHYPYSANPIKTADDKLNKVLSLCERTVKLGVQEGYIDCPTREKGQYLGDAFITGFAHFYLTRDGSLLKRALLNYAHSVEIYGDMLSVAPCTYRQKIADYTLLYPAAVLKLYGLTQDISLLESTFDACEFIINSFDKIKAEYWQLTDWPEDLRDGYEYSEDKPHAVFDALCIYAQKAYEQICSQLKRKCEIKSAALSREFNKKYLKNGIYTDSEESAHASVHSNALALAFDICSEKNKRTISGYLIKRGMQCSPYMAYFYLTALCRAGEYKEALDIIKNDGKHGWLNMINEGATTCFEVWSREEKWNTSLFHPWAVAPILIIYEHFSQLLL